MNWRGLLNAALGFWLISCPFTLGYKSLLLTQSDVICGILAILCGLLTLRLPLFAWATALIGIWLQLAPLIFGPPEAAAYSNDSFLGLLLLIFSIVIPDTPGAQQSQGAEVPPGWSYNPSSYLQRVPVIGLNIICWLIARYMAAYQLGFIDTIWDPFFGEGTVQVLTSSISKAFPVSDAGLGATMYLLEAVFGFGDPRRWHTMPWFVMMFGVLAVPVSCVSIVLIILQPTVVGAWCGPCLVTALLMLLIIPFALDEVVATFQFVKGAPQRGESRWKTFWRGSSLERGTTDSRTPHLGASYAELVRATAYGISIPWNLLMTAVIGIIAMGMGAYIPGALITVFSVMSWAEVGRSCRFAIVPFAGWLLLTHPILGALSLIFAFRKGVIKEKYGSLKIW